MLIVSACLIGKNCRYNAQTKLNIDVIEYLKDKSYTTFCPEEPLGTPREPIHVVGSKLFGNESQKDYTKVVKEHIEKFIEKKSISTAILKARSPSCAIKTFGESKNDGLFTQILRDKFKNIELIDEEIVGEI